MDGLPQVKFLCRLLLVLIGFAGSQPLCAQPTHPHRYKIAVIHSYERSYHDAERYVSLLREELDANDLEFEIREYFLNCDELEYYEELDRASYFIDDWDRWGADAAMVFNNQAVYSLLKCDNDRIRKIPLVFGGLYCPDCELIADYPNVTGFVDIPDYARTVYMIEQLFGPSRVVVMSGRGVIERTIWKNLKYQCARAGIQTYDGDVLSHISKYRVVKETCEEEKGAFFNERIDTTVVMQLMSEAMPLRLIQQTARGSHTYLMYTSRTFSSIDAPEFFNNPSFGSINEGFGSNDNMLGGYFAVLETQIADMARSLAERLRGTDPEQQIMQSRKEYVLNWHVLRRYGISLDKLLPEYRVMYVPFFVRYRQLVIGCSVSAGVIILLVIAYLIRSLAVERKRKRAALLDLLFEHETLKLAIEGGMTYAWRKVDGVLSFDSHFYALIGHKGRSISLEQILSYVHPDERERCRVNFLNNEHAGHRGEYRCNFDGAYQWWEFRYNFVSDRKNKQIITGLLQNIQQVKDREAELIEARRLAERAELKQSFLNNMSHEIRTPLNAIVGFSNMLVNTPDLSEEERQEFVKIISMNNEQLLNLINDILELSRIESGTSPLARKELNLRPILGAYYQTFKMQVKPQLEFLCDFPEEDVSVLSDPVRLQQVVINFLSNANKFTEKGYIKLGYRVHRAQHTVHIYVEDTGRGIPPEQFEMIFARFYKQDEFVSGTGLGLSICRSIVERMGGQIKVESEVGKGSRFTIVLGLPDGAGWVQPDNRKK